MVTAKGTEYDKVIGLDSGADDYVTKPFGMMELVSRIKAVLRRSGQTADKADLEVDGVKMNVKKHEVTVDGQAVTLTLKEYELLERLMRNRNIVLTRDQLLEDIWGYDFDGETRTVDVHVRTLRHKLGEKARSSRPCEVSVIGSEKRMRARIQKTMVLILGLALLLSYGFFRLLSIIRI